MNFFKKTLKGTIIGIGAVAPGISGGVLATILGIYEPIMEALAGFFKNIKKNTRFLLPYFLGGAIGFLLFSGIVSFFMSHAQTQVLFLFSGLVIGGFPALVAESNSEGFKYRYLIFTAVSYLFMTASVDLISIPTKNDFLTYLTGGIVYSFGSVIPGISASFMLINMGIYKDILSSILHPSVFIPFFSGFILTTVLLIKAVNFLFKKFHGYAYYTVMGLLAASVITAIPPFSNPVLDIFLLITGILLGFFFINP